MRLIICTLALFVFQPNWLTAQSIVKDIIAANTDSCSISIHQVVTLEMTKPFEEPFERELIRLKIAKQDSENLLKKASKKFSYQDERALLTHHNVIFHFYKNGTVYSTIQLSTLTGNVAIHILNTPEEFYNRVSKKFGHFIVKTLMNYDVLEIIPSDMQMLDKN